MTDAALEARDVHFSYAGGAEVIKNLTFSIPAGGFWSIVGPNGSGKSTLLKLLAGHLRPGRGRVAAQGRELAHTPRADMAR